MTESRFYSQFDLEAQEAVSPVQAPAPGVKWTLVSVWLLDGQGSSCEYCGHPIKWQCALRSNDGRRLLVGTDCAGQLTGPDQAATVKLLERRTRRAESQWRKQEPPAKPGETRVEYIRRRMVEYGNALRAHKAEVGWNETTRELRQVNSWLARHYTDCPKPPQVDFQSWYNHTDKKIERKYKANRFDFRRPIWDVRKI